MVNIPHVLRLKVAEGQELIFSREVQMTDRPPLFFNENAVSKTTLQKHIGMFLDSRLNFSEHLRPIFQKTNKTIGLLLLFFL